ncbi:MAG: 4'-phosphopantetheinyl transferase superfamily protein [Candidatus Omnitrophica bacterium]|nr:4'-phosphopantetheinyl transferase superfamily protein [Candidatus Omnitrophota bacterium]
MQSNKKLVGIGIDLVSWSRIKKFLASHSLEFLKRLLTPSEQIAFQRARFPHQFFARSFSAKEASFKACNGIVMGEENFREIEVSMLGDNRFHVALGNMGSECCLRSEGKFVEDSYGITAQVMIWKSSRESPSS